MDIETQESCSSEMRGRKGRKEGRILFLYCVPYLLTQEHECLYGKPL